MSQSSSDDQIHYQSCFQNCNPHLRLSLRLFLWFIYLVYTSLSKLYSLRCDRQFYWQRKQVYTVGQCSVNCRPSSFPHKVRGLNRRPQDVGGECVATAPPWPHFSWLVSWIPSQIKICCTSLIRIRLWIFSSIATSLSPGFGVTKGLKVWKDSAWVSVIKHGASLAKCVKSG